MVALLHLAGPESVPNSQIYSAAQSRDQAAVMFELAAKMVRMSPDLTAFLKIRDTAKELHCPELGTFYKALSAEATTAHGKSPRVIIHDELGQVKGPRSELYDALESAAAAHDEPLSIIISTQAPTGADLLSVLIDDALSGADPKTKVFLYTAPLELDPFSDEAIKAANPAFGDFLNPVEVRAFAEDARRMPAREAAYRNLTLNQRVDQRNALIARTLWEKATKRAVDLAAFERYPVYCGLDLSARNDLTAFARICQDENKVWHCQVDFFAPLIGIRERAARDRWPYDLWAEQGYLIATPGASVDYDLVAEHLCRAADENDLRLLAFDPHRMDVLNAALSRLGRELPLKKFGQYFKDMSPAIDALEAELLNERVAVGVNPVLTMCAANAIAIINKATGERKIDKAKETGRVDGIVALAMAFGSAAGDGVTDEGNFDEWLRDPILI